MNESICMDLHVDPRVSPIIICITDFHFLRYWEELKDDKYNDIDDKLRNQYAKLIHKFQNAYDATDTWYLSSCADAYGDDEGPNSYLIWNTKSRGYATIFDLLQVKVSCQILVSMMNVREHSSFFSSDN